jgi:NADH-quinone oxidoreductase subunit H
MSIYENKEARLPLERVAAPTDKHFRLRMKQHGLLNSNPRRSGILAAVIGYALLFGALLTNGLPFPWTGFGLQKTDFWYYVIYGLLAPVLAFLFVAVVALINILMLRKYLAKVQNRYGPLHNGPSGSLQTVYDALKLVSKEDYTPKMVEETIFTLAPVLVFVSAFLLMAVIPFAPGWVFANVEAGAIFIIAAGTIGGYGVLLAGWSMNNKYGLMGGLRAAAQLVSYEVPLSISLLAVCVYAGSMNLTKIVEAQQALWFAIPLFIPFVVYLVAGLAELKMTPFDLPEAESELVAGFNTEYGGMRFGFFFVAEFAELYLLPALLAVFFLGGWNAPSIPAPQGTFLNQLSGGAPTLELVIKANPMRSDFNNDYVVNDADVTAFQEAALNGKPLPKWRLDLNRDGDVNNADADLVSSDRASEVKPTLWQILFGPGSLILNSIYALIFLIKGAAGVYFYMWIRATLPRFRDDQLMELCWKGLIPLSLIGLVLAAFSRLMPVVGTAISILVGGAFLFLIVRGAFFPNSSSKGVKA